MFKSKVLSLIVVLAFVWVPPVKLDFLPASSAVAPAKQIRLPGSCWRGTHVLRGCCREDFAAVVRIEADHKEKASPVQAVAFRR